MGALLRNILGGKPHSNRRQKKQLSREVKRRRSGYGKRIMKIMQDASKHFFTIEKMCQMLNVKDDDCLNVNADVGTLARNYKVVWRSQRKDFGLFSYWIPLDAIKERIFAELATGKVCTYTDVRYAATLAYDAWCFEFSPYKLVDHLAATRVLTKSRNNDGGRVIYFTPEQFLEYELRNKGKVG